MSNRGRPKTPGVLTPREYEVLALLRDGLSNREVAERLGISLAGAKFHVSEIIGKLGVASREEAAAWRDRNVSVLVPLVLGLSQQRLSGMLAVLRVVALGTAVTVGLAVIVLLARSGGQLNLSEIAIAETPTAAAEPSPSSAIEQHHLSSLGPYVVGYSSRGGALVRFDKEVLTVDPGSPRGEVDVLIDDETMILRAAEGRIVLDRDMSDLRDGRAIATYFDSPLPDSAVAATPVDTIVLGYFKFMRGEVVDLGTDYADVRIEQALIEAASTLFEMNDNVVRVWMDEDAQFSDVSVAQEGVRVGARMGFSGLVMAQGEPVVYQVIIE